MYCIKKKKKLPSVTLAVLINKRHCLRSPVSSMWIQQLYKESRCMGVELMVLVICKPPRPNLRVYLGFSVCPLGFRFPFGLGTVSPFIAKSVLWCLKLLLMSNGGKEQKKKNFFYKVIKFKTELFKCCCFYLSVLVRKWNIPRVKRKGPLGSLNRQKPQPRIQHPLPSSPEFLQHYFPVG